MQSVSAHTRDMIITWIQAGYTAEEIHQTIPHIPIDAIRAIITHHTSQQ